MASGNESFWDGAPGDGASVFFGDVASGDRSSRDGFLGAVRPGTGRPGSSAREPNSLQLMGEHNSDGFKPYFVGVIHI